MREYYKLHPNEIDWYDLQENNPELYDLIYGSVNKWKEFEQLPDLSMIPMEYQHMIPENIRKNEEDNRVQHIMLTKW